MSEFKNAMQHEKLKSEMSSYQMGYSDAFDIAKKEMTKQFLFYFCLGCFCGSVLMYIISFLIGIGVYK